MYFKTPRKNVKIVVNRMYCNEKPYDQSKTNDHV